MFFFRSIIDPDPNCSANSWNINQETTTAPFGINPHQIASSKHSIPLHKPPPLPKNHLRLPSPHPLPKRHHPRHLLHPRLPSPRPPMGIPQPRLLANPKRPPPPPPQKHRRPRPPHRLPLPLRNPRKEENGNLLRPLTPPPHPLAQRLETHQQLHHHHPLNKERG